MFLLCESGATKAAWRLCDGSREVARTLTPGINVSTMEEAAIRAIIQTAAGQLMPGREAPGSIHFYTAGVVSPVIGAWLLPALQEAFGATETELQSDLVAAARAGCGRCPSRVS